LINLENRLFALLTLLVPFPDSATAADQTPSPQLECRSDVSKSLARIPSDQGRALIVFAGSQQSLLVLWEVSKGPWFETSFFPLTKDQFVLTITLRKAPKDVASINAYAALICPLALDHGARFDGVILYSGNSMISALMAPAAPR
jgi:hypothetical protein